MDRKTIPRERWVACVRRFAASAVAEKICGGQLRSNRGKKVELFLRALSLKYAWLKFIPQSKWKSEFVHFVDAVSNDDDYNDECTVQDKTK